MTRLLLTALISAASTAAIAHSSSVPHAHPHDVNGLPELSAMLLAAFVVGVGALVVRRFGRRS